MLLTKRLVGWLAEWLPSRLTGWLTDWLTGWLTDWLTVFTAGWCCAGTFCIAHLCQRKTYANSSDTLIYLLSRWPTSCWLSAWLTVWIVLLKGGCDFGFSYKTIFTKKPCAQCMPRSSPYPTLTYSHFTLYELSVCVCMYVFKGIVC